MIFYRWKNWLVFCIFSKGGENNFKNGWAATNKRGINLWAYFGMILGHFSLIKEFYWQATLFDGIEEIIFDIIATSLRNSLFLCSSRKALENLPKTELPLNNVQPTFQFIGCEIQSSGKFFLVKFDFRYKTNILEYLIGLFLWLNVRRKRVENAQATAVCCR